MTGISAPRLEMVRMVREHCTSVVDVPEGSSPIAFDRTTRQLCARALEVPVETMAPWFEMTDTVLANLRKAMAMVEQNYEMAEVYAKLSGAIQVTYDGVTYTRGHVVR